MQWLRKNIVAVAFGGSVLALAGLVVTTLERKEQRVQLAQAAQQCRQLEEASERHVYADSDETAERMDLVVDVAGRRYPCDEVEKVQPAARQ